MTADEWKPIDFVAEFAERENLLRDIAQLLQQSSQSKSGRVWAHHLPRMTDALHFFRALLQEEIEHWGEWRDHGFQPDEVLDIIDEDLDQVAEWLTRMTTPPKSRADLKR